MSLHADTGPPLLSAIVRFVHIVPLSGGSLRGVIVQRISGVPIFWGGAICDDSSSREQKSSPDPQRPVQAGPAIGIVFAQDVQVRIQRDWVRDP